VSKRQTERRHASIPHATMYDKGRDDADDKLHLDHDATPRHALPPSPCNRLGLSALPFLSIVSSDLWRVSFGQ